MANCRASSYGSLNVVLSVAASPILSVTAARPDSTVSESGRPTTSRSKIRPRCSRSRSPSARKKKSNLPRSAAWARCTNDEKSIWLPDVGIAPHRRVVHPREVSGEMDLLHGAGPVSLIRSLLRSPVLVDRRTTPRPATSWLRTRSAWSWVMVVTTSSSGAGHRDQGLEPVDDGGRRADELRVDAVGDQLTVLVGPEVLRRLLGSRERDRALAGADAAHPEPVGRGEVARGGVVVARPTTSADTATYGSRQLCRWTERGPIRIRPLRARWPGLTW